MDAEVSTSIAVERVTEPFSGMALLRVIGYWQGPESHSKPACVEVHYDDRTATRFNLVPARAADIPAGCLRFNIGTQLPVEAGVREVAVVLVYASSENEIYRREWREVGFEPATESSSG